MSPGQEPAFRNIPFHLMLTLASLTIIVSGLRAAEALIIPILLSIFIAVICASPVHWLYRRGMNSYAAVLITLLILGGLLALFGTLLGNSVAMFMERWPEMQQELQGHYLNLLEWLAHQGMSVSPRELSSMIDDSQDKGWISVFLSGLGVVLSQSLVILLMVNFMLFETLDFRQKVARALANPGPSLERFTEFSHNLKRYMAVKTVVSLITGALVTLAAWLVGVEFALLWGALAFILNYIPNIGSVIAAVPPVLLTLSMPDGGMVKALTLSGAYLAINFVIGNLVEPRVMGRTMGLSTLVAFLSLVVWGWILGPVGMLLSVPLTMTLKIALDSHPETRWIAKMLGPSERRQRRLRKTQQALDELEEELDP
ncbi:AI-2E family transporter [Salinicola sp. JS01]|uniref:AI-2E family transporter n=1 Tax=Salinicola sp. JS01 TaxID=3050071 RepID=UPI00255B6124|nr:AI-2E family transporter [Salinicola sp. JS01]WIX34331.1 AI-2E family transporter [Salinicola sp. JS01]